ncbi:hypothetical protein AAA799B03_01269 [Marine Group I thaumarchaeote SCGC AAA799-B03]|uniref:Uncharacterized protein n=3 Tax=Marine Group I TaxID=905826 RepID=A0A087S641_9ARCH|nr:hypothetical protein AAA799N04_01486 [Marine Group I thaumarchaeote SCGC AAA799-N04]KFM17926.1 hypothetical protein SCCGRSA3_01465 [Marine Group I thaumarchaeote SCGC RSA3]KFM21195.1 hypothetical protein AAA799B03_01269 [Marine Group I thaumarchaeote SCGC AAA799-B03]
MSQKRPYRKFSKKEPSLTREQKIEKFILRNSENGFFTKVTTIPYKFEISESKAWDIVGELLSNGKIESVHDGISGEMKLCKAGQMYSIMNSEKKRKNK